MNDSISYRIASKADLPQILRLYTQPDFDDGRVLSANEAESILDRIGQYPNYKLFVAICEGNIVGTFALLIMDNLGHMGARSAIIEDMAVDPTLQGRGIGKAMMKYALGLANKEGCYKAMLSSNLKRERAHAFYESLKFERHGYSFLLNAQPAHAADAERYAPDVQRSLRDKT
ncbi:GNAT family N-acetyltransferase [Candidatus Hydrogenedentota bacterium]